MATVHTKLSCLPRTSTRSDPRPASATAGHCSQSHQLSPSPPVGCAPLFFARYRAEFRASTDPLAEDLAALAPGSGMSSSENQVSISSQRKPVQLPCLMAPPRSPLNRSGGVEIEEVSRGTEGVRAARGMLRCLDRVSVGRRRCPVGPTAGSPIAAIKCAAAQSSSTSLALDLRRGLRFRR
jgi:hypothetical protein